MAGYRRLTLWRVSVPQSRLQRVELRQNPFQRKKGLCSVRIFLFSEGRETAQVKHLPADEARKLLGNFMEGRKKI